MPGLNDEERALIDSLASAIVARKLASPAIFILESMRPLRFIASQAMLFFAPIVEMTLPIKQWGIAQRLLERREGLDELLDAIERLDQGVSLGNPGQDDSGVSSGGDR